jgi:hypothetical protein
MNTNIRYTILGLVFILSTVFFWLALNEYILTSKAQQSSDLQIVPHAKNIECNPQGECYLQILGSTATSNALAGVTGQVMYSQYLEPSRVDLTGLCKTSTYGLDTPLQFNIDSQNKIVTFSVGALKDDAALKGGNGCIATLVFKPTGVQQNPQEAKLNLVAGDTWKAGGLINGQRGIFKPQVESSTVMVSIDSSVKWPEDGTGGGPVPTQPSQCLKSKGDCNCDNRIDLIDWEMLRSAMQSEGGSCDVNGDGTANALDASIWLENNHLVRPIIITKDQ